MKIRHTPNRRSPAAKKKPHVRETAAPTATPPSPPSATRFLPWAIVLLIILSAAVVRIRLLEIPLERDEGEYAYAGQLLLQGVPPYQAAFNMKFPGVYGAYAIIMAAFGQTTAGIHLGFLLLNAGTIVLVFLLGRRLFTTAAGVAAAAAYALLSVGAEVYGTQAHATHFVVAAALGATLLLLRAVDSGSSAMLFLSGLLYGVAILMKQHGAFFAIFAGLYLLVDHWIRRPGTWLAMLRKLALFLLGLVVPLALTGWALWHAGVFEKFWFWTVTYAREYVSELSFAEADFKGTFLHVVGPNLLLWILACAGLVMLFWKKQDRGSASFAAAFLIFSFLAVCPGWYFRPHYFVLMLPAVALLAGAIVSSTRKITWLLFGAFLGISIAQQSDFLFRLSPLEACLQMYGNSPFPEAVQVADYIRAHSEKAARIAVLGSEPEIYFYANRRSATGYIYTYGLMDPKPFALTMQNEMIRDLESARPEYVVFVNAAGSWTRRAGSQAKILDWWNTYSAQNYSLVGAVDMDLSAPFSAEYHWDHLESYRPRSPLYIAILKRNS